MFWIHYHVYYVSKARLLVTNKTQYNFTFLRPENTLGYCRCWTDVAVHTLVYVTRSCHKNNSTLEKKPNNQLIHTSSQLHLTVLNKSQTDVCTNIPETQLWRNNVPEVTIPHNSVNCTMGDCGVSLTSLTRWTSHWTGGCLCRTQLLSDNTSDRRHRVTGTPGTRQAWSS